MSRHNARPIVVVGSINMDLVSSAAKIPAAGETILGTGFAMHPGGKGANQAVAVARLGYPVHMIGKLGSDVFGEELRKHLERAGVGLQGVAQVDGPSGTASIVVAENGDNSIVVNSAANADLSPACLEKQLPLLKEAAIVLTQLETPLDTVAYLADICEREKITLILDPAPAQALPPELLKKVTWFTPNETEADFYSTAAANDDPTDRATRIRRLGPEGVILKLGSRGAYLSSGETQIAVPAPSVKVVDTTAAGDTFNGAFAVALMLGKPVAESVRFAIAAASISVTRAGAQPSMPTMEEVEQLLRA